MKRIATTLLVAGLMATPMLVLPPTARAGVNIGINVAVGIPPPALPVYAQPVVPGPGYIWTPGYWAWDPDVGDYYWVPGTWVLPPQIGLLWTPGWWGWSDGFYRWHAGYWGPRVGFYGGVNYGFGYFGVGYVGGYWHGRDFFYNRAVNNINITNVRNVYVNKTVINNINVNRVSYNGGRGGIVARPTPAQLRYASERHIQPTPIQMQQRQMAMRDPAQRFKASQGRPAVFATRYAGHFEGPHSVRTPVAADSPMMEAPQRGHMVTAPHGRMMAAPERQHGMEYAPADAAARSEQRPAMLRERPDVRAQPPMERMPVRQEMPHERPMPMHQPQSRREQQASPGRREDMRHPPKDSGNFH